MFAFNTTTLLPENPHGFNLGIVFAFEHSSGVNQACYYLHRDHNDGLYIHGNDRFYGLEFSKSSHNVAIQDILNTIDIPYEEIFVEEFTAWSQELAQYNNPAFFDDNVDDILLMRVTRDISTCTIVMITDYWLADGEAPEEPNYPFLRIAPHPTQPIE
jgi:hypothetical protein